MRYVEKVRNCEKKAQLLFIIISCRHITAKIYKTKNIHISLCAGNFPCASADLCLPFPPCSVTQKADLFRLYHLGSLSLPSSWVCLMGCPSGKWEDKKRQKEGYCFLHLPASHPLGSDCTPPLKATAPVQLQLQFLLGSDNHSPESCLF